MIKNKENKQLGIKSVIDVCKYDLSQEAKNILCSISNQESSISYKNLDLKTDKNLEFDFRDYKFLKELFIDIYYKKFAIEEAEKMQDVFNCVCNAEK